MDTLERLLSELDAYGGKPVAECLSRLGEIAEAVKRQRSSTRGCWRRRLVRNSMTEIRVPKQLEASSNLIRSWSIDHPKFYGVKATDQFVDELFEVESQLEGGVIERLNPQICRVLAAYHGPKGAKVPLSTSTVSGCVRPSFVAINQWLKPGEMSCYKGGCYLYHARAVPAKTSHELKVRAHTTPVDGLVAAGRLSRHFGVPIRDNQSSDGSLSMVLPCRDDGEPQLLTNLRTLCERGFDDVPYLCFSAAYTRVADINLEALSLFPNLIVHITVSGWHSKEENRHRLNEFERYKKYLPASFLRVVNRQDWACCVSKSASGDSGEAAMCEGWLLEEITNRGFEGHVIRTPFHSVHPFPGSQIGNLGSRHMATTDYLDSWQELLSKSSGECCTTGKCKSCPTRCGIKSRAPRSRNPYVAAQAFSAMYCWETTRSDHNPESALTIYTTRLLAKKAAEQATEAGHDRLADEMRRKYVEWKKLCENLNLTTMERRRLTNDSHALAIDGLDRHKLWKMAIK